MNPFSGEAGRSEREEEEVYDPAFLLPLISHLLDPGPSLYCPLCVILRRVFSCEVSRIVDLTHTHKVVWWSVVRW